MAKIKSSRKKAKRKMEKKWASKKRKSKPRRKKTKRLDKQKPIKLKGEVDDRQQKKTIKQLRDLLLKKPERLLHLNPVYQRGSVWKRKAKSYLIDSVLAGWVIPEIYLKQYKKNGSTHYDVVDGQQRLRTFFDFIDGKYTTGNESGNDFKILKSEAGGEIWAGKAFDDLDIKERKKILNTELKLRILYNTSDEQVKQVFRRINTYVSKLTDQQLRNADYARTKFLEQVNKIAVDWHDWLTAAEWGVVSSDDVQLMKFQDIVINEILLFAHRGTSGTNKTVRTSLYKDNSDSYDDKVAIRKNLDKVKKRIQAVFSKGVAGTRFTHSSDFVALFSAFYELECGLRDEKKKYGYTGKAGEVYTSLKEFSDELDNLMQESPRTPDDISPGVSSEVRQYYCIMTESFGTSHTTSKATREERHAGLLQVLLTPKKGTKTNPAYSALDKKRNFTEVEKRIIFARVEKTTTKNGKIVSYCECNICQTKIYRSDWPNFQPDHIHPHAKAGETILDNAQVLCKRCNQAAGAKTK